MFQNLRCAGLPVLFLLGALTVTASAQDVRTARFQRTYGPGEANATLDVTATVSRTVVKYASTESTRARGRAYISLFGQSGEAIGLDANVVTRQGTIQPGLTGPVGLQGPRTGSATIALRLCGRTIFNESVVQTKLWSGVFGPYDLVTGGVSQQYMVGPIPVVVTANAGVGMSAALIGTLDLTYLQAQLEGVVQGHSYGWASAGIGTPLASAGVQLTLRLLDTTITQAMTCSLQGLSGRLLISVEPARVYLQLYAALWPKRWTYTVWTWALDAWTWASDLY